MFQVNLMSDLFNYFLDFAKTQRPPVYDCCLELKFDSLDLPCLPVSYVWASPPVAHFTDLSAGLQSSPKHISRTIKAKRMHLTKLISLHYLQSRLLCILSTNVVRLLKEQKHFVLYLTLTKCLIDKAETFILLSEQLKHI